MTSMLFSSLLAVLLFSAASGLDENTVEGQLAKWNGSMGMGTNHWGFDGKCVEEKNCQYVGGNLLTDGAEWLKKQTTAMPLKITLNKSKYNISGEKKTTLVDMVTDPVYVNVLKDKTFPVIALVAFGDHPGGCGSDDHPYTKLCPDSDWKTLLEEIKTDFEKLTEHLMQEYPGKTFILQNWEGDNALGRIKEAALDLEKTRMAQWFSARQEGVDLSREKMKGNSKAALVLHAAEVNVLRPKEGKYDHVFHILLSNPALEHKPDLVSYSYYEWGKKEISEGVENLREGLEKIQQLPFSNFATNKLDSSKRMFVGEFASGLRLNNGDYVDEEFIKEVGLLQAAMKFSMSFLWNLQNNESETRHFGLREGVGLNAKKILPLWNALVDVQCTFENNGCKYNCNTKEIWLQDKKEWCCKFKKKGCPLCPEGCAKWFDGCNTCRCDENRELVECTEMVCGEKEKPKCLKKVIDVCPITCSSWFDGCNICKCEAVGVVEKDCTEKDCLDQQEPMCNKYDCNTEEIWTKEKKEWCCNFEKKGCPNALDVYMTFPELGLGEVIETDEKDQENFKAKLKEMKQVVPKWLKNRSNKSPKVMKKYKCNPQEAEAAKCNVDAGETCLRMQVLAPPEKYSDSADGDAEGQGTTGTREPNYIYKPWCLRPCAKVCTGISLKCGQLAEDPPAYPTWWANFENRPCFQMERKQGAKKKHFMRWSCRCPDRDYTVSDSCTPNAGASLSNCVRAWIVQAPEINFQDLSSVQLGYVRSTNEDIDFQGKVDKSIFCRIDAQDDVEFGGGKCPANLQNNVFFNTVMKEDFQFEEGATMRDNILFNVEVGDNFEIQDETGTYPTAIEDNLFGNVQVSNDCKIDTGGVTINGNSCTTFAHSGSGSGCGNTPWANPGFSCL